MKAKLVCCLGCVTAALTAFANFDIELDMKAQPIRDVGMKPYADTMTVTIEPNTIQSVTVATRNAPQPR